MLMTFDISKLDILCDKSLIASLLATSKKPNLASTFSSSWTFFYNHKRETKTSPNYAYETLK